MNKQSFKSREQELREYAQDTDMLTDNGDLRCYDCGKVYPFAIEKKKEGWLFYIGAVFVRKEKEVWTCTPCVKEYEASKAQYNIKL